MELSKISVREKILTRIATLWTAGYFPVAPGSAGTLCGTIFLLIFKPTEWTLVALTALVCVVGVAASGVAEVVLQKKDSGHIVIDEFAGCLITMFFVEQSLLNLAMGFFIFRFFDIVKPPPVNWMEKLSGGYGVMMDDVMAAAYANLALRMFVHMQVFY
jgi:phosphatidylglycerophosphatase A